MMILFVFGIFVFFLVDGNLFFWCVIIEGFEDMLYVGFNFKFSFEFFVNYLYMLFIVFFIIFIYYFNVDFFGCICFDIFKDKWMFVYNI